MSKPVPAPRTWRHGIPSEAVTTSGPSPRGPDAGTAIGRPPDPSIFPLIATACAPAHVGRDDDDGVVPGTAGAPGGDTRTVGQPTLRALVHCGDRADRRHRVRLRPPLHLGSSLTVRWQTLALALVVFVCLAAAGTLARRARLRADDLLYIAIGAAPGRDRRRSHRLRAARAGGVRRWSDSLLDPAVGGLELGLAVVGGMLPRPRSSRPCSGRPSVGGRTSRRSRCLSAIAAGKLTMVLGGSGQGRSFEGDWATAFLGPGPWVSLAPAVPSHPAQVYEGVGTRDRGGPRAGRGFARRVPCHGRDAAAASGSRRGASRARRSRRSGATRTSRAHYRPVACSPWSSPPPRSPGHSSSASGCPGGPVPGARLQHPPGRDPGEPDGHRSDVSWSGVDARDEDRPMTQVAEPDRPTRSEPGRINHWIGGRLVEGTSGRHGDVYDPADRARRTSTSTSPRSRRSMRRSRRPAQRSRAGARRR